MINHNRIHIKIDRKQFTSEHNYKLKIAQAKAIENGISIHYLETNKITELMDIEIPDEITTQKATYDHIILWATASDAYEQHQVNDLLDMNPYL